MDSSMQLPGFAASSASKTGGPLAERMRPENLAEWVGQEHLIGEGQFLTELLKKNNPNAFPSLIFWGPPGCGKTTLAHLIAGELKMPFANISAINTGTADAKKILHEAENLFQLNKTRTLLFIDEIHRFNKSQQDVFLHSLEKGPILLIGATTENPSFELNRAILSRARVLTLHPISKENILTLLSRALTLPERGLASNLITLENEALDFIADVASGDARSALSTLEALVHSTKPESHLKLEEVRSRSLKAQLSYDKKGENHYNFISALHKSIRNSDPDAALLWLGRMMESGEDPNFILRRLVRAAYEDIGLADPQAGLQAAAAIEAVNLLGYPECDVVLAQLCIYLACAPKSDAAYQATKEVKRYIQNHPEIDVPIHLRNAPTSLMKDLGYGKNYSNDHKYPQHVGPEQSWPNDHAPKQFYEPGSLGFEKEIQKRLDFFKTSRPKKAHQT